MKVLAVVALLLVCSSTAASWQPDTTLVNRNGVVLLDSDYTVWLGLAGVERLAQTAAGWNCSSGDGRALCWSFHLSAHSPALVRGCLDEDACIAAATGTAQVAVPGPRIGRLGRFTALLQLAVDEAPARDEAAAVLSQSRLELFVVPGVLSVLPPFVAIASAVLSRQVILSLMAGIWLGALFVERYDPAAATLRYIDLYVVDALSDRSHAQVLLFALMLGGLIELVTRSRGSAAVVGALSRHINCSQKVQWVAWLLGLLICFDDYSTILVVGPAMIPLFNHFAVSRAKLAFLVDTTAASTSSFVFLSSWLGFQLGLLHEQFRLHHIDIAPFRAFMFSCLYRFYDVGLMVIVAALLALRRDFGPMYDEEVQVRHATNNIVIDSIESNNIQSSNIAIDSIEPNNIQSSNIAIDSIESNNIQSNNIESNNQTCEPQPWWNAVVPLVVLLGTIIVGLPLDGLVTARAAGMKHVDLEAMMANADAFSVLIWAAFFSSVVAVLLVTWQRTMSLGEALDCWFDGTKSVLTACFILMHSWAIGVVCSELQSSVWLLAALGDAFPVRLLPATIFLLALVISFTTGSSWATMAMGFPIVVPLSWSLSGHDEYALYHTIGATFAGAVFGDHASPLSDTTILTTTMCSCDLMLHVRTQLPYALVTAAAAVLFGHLLCGLFLPMPLAHLCVWAAIVVAVLLLGKRIPVAHGPGQPLTGQLDTASLLGRLVARLCAASSSSSPPAPAEHREAIAEQEE